MSTITSVTPTTETSELKISPARAVQAREVYMQCCKKLAEHISSNPDTFGSQDLQALIESIPEPTFKVSSSKKSSKSKKAPKYTIDNWKECESKEDLKKSLKTKDLKDILSAESLPISGKKDDLLDRVWGITHPDEAPELPEKSKRGRKKSSKSSKKSTEDITSVEDSEDEAGDNSTVSSEMSADDVEALLETRQSIFINKDGFQGPKLKGSTEYKLVKEKGWVFRETETEFEFTGILIEEGGKKKLQGCEAPEELMACFAEE